MRRTYFRRGIVKKVVLFLLILLFGVLFFVGGKIIYDRVILEYNDRITEDREYIRLYEEKLDSLSRDFENLLAEKKKEYVSYGIGLAVEERENRHSYRCTGFALPDDAVNGNIYDVRILYPDGTSYIVLAAKSILGISEDRSAFTLLLNEEELLLMYSAFLDVKTYSDCAIELTGYLNRPGESKVNYTPSFQTLELLQHNPQIDELKSEYLSGEVRHETENRMKEYLREEKSVERTDSDIFQRNTFDAVDP